MKPFNLSKTVLATAFAISFASVSLPPSVFAQSGGSGSGGSSSGSSSGTGTTGTGTTGTGSGTTGSGLGTGSGTGSGAGTTGSGLGTGLQALVLGLELQALA